MTTIKAYNFVTNQTFVETLPLHNPMNAVKYIKSQIKKGKELRSKDNDNWQDGFWRFYIN